MTGAAATPYRPEMHRRLWHTLCRERCRRPWRVPSVAELARWNSCSDEDLAVEYVAACELARLVRVYPASPERVDVATAHVRPHDLLRAGLIRPLDAAMRIAPDPDWPRLHPAPVVYPREPAGGGESRRIDVPGIARLRVHYRPDSDVVVRTVWDLRPHGEAS